MSCGLISLKASVKSCLNFNLCTLISFSFLFALVSSIGTVSSLPDISMFGSSWFTAELLFCWVSFVLLVFVSADLKDCCACSPSYVFNFGGCSLWIVFDCDIPTALDWPKTSCVGNTSCTVPWALAILGSLFKDWNVSDTFIRNRFSYLPTLFNIWFWGSTKLSYRHSFWISSNGVDWQEFNCPIHTKQVPFMVSAPQTWHINAEFTISNFSLVCNTKSVFDR